MLGQVGPFWHFLTVRELSHGPTSLKIVVGDLIPLFKVTFNVTVTYNVTVTFDITVAFNVLKSLKKSRKSQKVPKVPKSFKKSQKHQTV